MERLIQDPMGSAREYLDHLSLQLDRQEPLQATRKLLAALRADREAHFRGEEAVGGLFQELRSLQPGVEPRVAALEGEHPVLLAAIAELLERLGELEDAIHRVYSDAREVLQTLQDHERAEADLVVEVHYTDVGVGD